MHRDASPHAAQRRRRPEPARGRHRDVRFRDRLDRSGALADLGAHGHPRLAQPRDRLQLWRRRRSTSLATPPTSSGSSPASRDRPAPQRRETSHQIRTTQWENSTATSTDPCGQGGGLLRFKKVNITVTWEHMRPGSEPVFANTVISPNTRINNPQMGTILVSVLDAAGNGVQGVTVSAVPASPPNGAQTIPGNPVADRLRRLHVHPPGDARRLQRDSEQGQLHLCEPEPHGDGVRDGRGQHVGVSVVHLRPQGALSARVLLEPRAVRDDPERSRDVVLQRARRGLPQRHDDSELLAEHRPVPVGARATRSSRASTPSPPSPAAVASPRAPSSGRTGLSAVSPSPASTRFRSRQRRAAACRQSCRWGSSRYPGSMGQIPNSSGPSAPHPDRATPGARSG